MPNHVIVPLVVWNCLFQVFVLKGKSRLIIFDAIWHHEAKNKYITMLRPNKVTLKLISFKNSCYGPEFQHLRPLLTIYDVHVVLEP